MRFASFVVSFLVAAAMMVLCAVAAAGAMKHPGKGESGIVILGGLLFLIPFGGWALAEYQSYVRGRHDFESQAAFCSLAFGGLLLFAVIVSLLSAVQEEPGKVERPPAPLSVVLPILGLGGWLVGAGMWRLKRVRESDSRADDEAVDADPSDEPLEDSPSEVRSADSP